jgi:hypothetical protein
MRVRVSLSVAVALSVLLALTVPVARVAPMAASPVVSTSVSPVVTDQAKLLTSNKFAMSLSEVVVTNDGEVLFNNNNVDALFRWRGSALSRLLQTNDPMPGYPGSLLTDAGFGLRANSKGSVALVTAWLQKGVDGAFGVFVLHGAAYEEIAASGATAPDTNQQFWQFSQIFINASDQVAFFGRFGPKALGLTNHGLFVGRPGTAVKKVALNREPAPGTSGVFDALTLRGLGDDGTVIFHAWVLDGLNRYSALYRWQDPGPPQLIVRAGDPAPSTGSTFGSFNPSRVWANGQGHMALQAPMAAGGRGIWVWNGATLEKLAAPADESPLPDNPVYDGNIQLLGFNDDDKVLFSANAGVGHALFVGQVGSATDVVFKRGDAVGEDFEESFLQTQRAMLNNSGTVAFLASLQNGTAPLGWFTWSGSTPSKVVLQGESALGGVVALAGCTSMPFAFQGNGGDALVFTADVIGPDFRALISYDGTLTKIVGSNDDLPAGANLVIWNWNGPLASRNELLFKAFRAGGAATYFTVPLTGAAKVRRIAGEGDRTPDGATIITLTEAWINNRNTVSVLTDSVLKTASQSFPEQAIYTVAAGATGLRRVVGAGDLAPTTPAAPYIGITAHRLNDANQIAFDAWLGSSLYEGIFVGGPAQSVRPVAIAGDPIPDMPGQLFADFQPQGDSRLAINDGGLVVFDAYLDDGTYGLFAHDAVSGMQTIVKTGDELQDLSGETWQFSHAVPPFNFRVSESGWVAYSGWVEAADPQGGNGVHLWRGPGSGPPVILAQAGTPAPGGTDAAFRGINNFTVDINNAGTVAFGALLRETAGRETAGYFLFDGQTLHAQLMEGDPLPGGGAAGPVGYGGVGPGALALSESGELAMVVPNVTGVPSFRRYVIADAAGTLRELASVNTIAPGTGGGTFLGLYSLKANPSGQFVFFGWLDGKHTTSGVFASSLHKK